MVLPLPMPTTLVSALMWLSTAARPARFLAASTEDILRVITVITDKVLELFWFLTECECLMKPVRRLLPLCHKPGMELALLGSAHRTCFLDSKSPQLCVTTREVLLYQ